MDRAVPAKIEATPTVGGEYDERAVFDQAGGFASVEPEGLENARDTVTKMHPEEHEAEEVKTRNQRIVEAQDNHRRHIMTPLEIVEMRVRAHSSGELEHVENKEAENNKSAQRHGAHVNRALHARLHCIARGFGSAVFDDQRERGKYVD